jgi:hypothetical protein
MKRTIFRFIFLSLLTGIMIPKQSFPQSAVSVKELGLTGGFILNADFADEYLVRSGYIAPSFRIKRHELYAGPVITRLSHLYAPRVVIGGVAGYKYYILKEPARVNMFLHYSLQYFHDSYSSYSYNGYYIAGYEGTWHKFVNTFGFGFNIFLDNKRRFSLYNTMGYSICPQYNKEYYSIYPDQNTSSPSHRRSTNWQFVNATLGLSVRLASFNK